MKFEEPRDPVESTDTAETAAETTDRINVYRTSVEAEIIHEVIERPLLDSLTTTESLEPVVAQALLEVYVQNLDVNRKGLISITPLQAEILAGFLNNSYATKIDNGTEVTSAQIGTAFEKEVENRKIIESFEVPDTVQDLFG